VRLPSAPLVVLGLIVAVSCGGKVEQPDLAESLGTAIPAFRSLRGVSLGRTTARSIRKSRPAARDVQYLGLVDTIPEGRIYFTFPRVADAPVSGFARVNAVSVSMDAATDSGRQAMFDALRRSIATRADSQPRCYRARGPDKSEGIEYHVGDLFVSMWRAQDVTVGVSKTPSTLPEAECREILRSYELPFGK
jgi:hypothetical protein